MRYYPNGAEDSERPVEFVLRAFTYENGGLVLHDADIRNVFVWCSGITERWIKVDDFVKALMNLDGRFGENQPIAVIDLA